MKKITKHNREILKALTDMVEQHFYLREDGSYSHSFMSADENAISILEDYGIAKEVAPSRYRIIADIK